MPLFNNLKVSLGENLFDKLRRIDPECRSYRVLKKSLDARKKSNIHFVYNIETFPTEEAPKVEFEKLEKVKADSLPMTTVIGAGPAGLFAALRLVERGMPCQIIERGKKVTERMRDISRHWKKGKVDPDSNVCFGEGGAGTFSDGKLITRIKSPYISYVKEGLVRFGAPEDILYLSNPHVGSNKIRKIIHNLTNWLNENGCPVHFETRAQDFKWQDNKLISVTTPEGKAIKSDNWILATGHSAHDTYAELLEGQVPIEAKSMAMGFRIEHPQQFINETQYGSACSHEDMPVANYRITCHDKKNDVGVYSFCMCPGGYVLLSSAQDGRMVCNGMSNYNHGSPFANSGLVISIDKDTWYPEGPQGALDFQKEIEVKAYQKVIEAGGTTQIPAQRVSDFLKNRVGDLPRSSCPSGAIAVNLRDIFPKKLTQAYDKALQNFERKMPGFTKGDAVLYGVESRTSSPLRILREKTELNSPLYTNLYPAGEGAGFAGGITSAAVDGIRASEAITNNYTKSNSKPPRYHS